MMTKLAVCFVLFLAVFVHCVHSIPSSFGALRQAKAVFNSSGVYGGWSKNLNTIAVDQAKNCWYYAQSNGKRDFQYYSPVQRLRRAWIEGVMDISELNGLGRTNNSDILRILSVRPKAGLVAAVAIVQSSSGSGLSGMIVINYNLKPDSEFEVPSSGFHRYTMSYDYDTLNVTVYIDDVYVTSYIAESFPGSYPYSFDCGYGAGDTILPVGTGKLYVKECGVFVDPVESIYVDGKKGDDENDGLTAQTPLKTVKAASWKAVSGTTVYIADGEYREHDIVPGTSDHETKFMSFVGTGDNVHMNGAVSASDFIWTKGSDNIWSADVSAVLGKAPIIVTYKNDEGEYVRLHQARTPNYRVDTPWNYQEFWNTAMGGKSIMDCFGQDDCDDSGNADGLMLADEFFKTADDLVGARIYMTDSSEAHYMYNSTIVAHDKVAGTITTDKKRTFDLAQTIPGIGMYTQYFVYGKKSMIDQEGEYAFEEGMLYIKWSGKDLPDSLEFSAYGTAFLLSGKKYVKLHNIRFTHYDNKTIDESAGMSGLDYDGSTDIYITRCNFDYIMSGIVVIHGTTNANSRAYNWHIDRCSISHADSNAISVFSSSKNFPHIALSDFWVTNNYFYHIGFFSENTIGVSANTVKNFYYFNNTMNYTAHNGLQFSHVLSKNGEIVSGDSIVRGNLFNAICSASSDCGCVKFYSKSESHVWKNMLVTENICQNTFGYTVTQENRAHSREGGFHASGYYTDHVSGPVFYRNIAYNIGSGGFSIYLEWEDGKPVMILNNLVVSASGGVTLTGDKNKQDVDVSILNNVFLDINHLGFKFNVANYQTPFDMIDLNNNLYYHVGWNGTVYNSGVCALQDTKSRWQVAPTFETLHKKMSENWETTAYSFDPEYGDYEGLFNITQGEPHQIYTFEDGTFAVTSELIDKGTEEIPKALTDLLKFFGIKDVKKGKYYDLGPYEDGVDSWIPSSSKTGVPSSSSSAEDSSLNSSVKSSEEHFVSSASSLFVSVSVLVACLFMVLF